MGIILKQFQLGTATIKAKLLYDGTEYEATCILVILESNSLDVFAYMRTLGQSPSEFGFTRAVYLEKTSSSRFDNAMFYETDRNVNPKYMDCVYKLYLADTSLPKKNITNISISGVFGGAYCTNTLYLKTHFLDGTVKEEQAISSTQMNANGRYYNLGISDIDKEIDYIEIDFVGTFTVAGGSVSISITSLNLIYE